MHLEHSQDDQFELDLPAVLNSAAAVNLYESLSQLPLSGVILNGSNVKWIGGQCLQILLSSQRSACLRGETWRISNMSDGLSDHLRLLGITDDLLTNAKDDMI
jgi:chemotaxis protein CheX